MTSDDETAEREWLEFVVRGTLDRDGYQRERSLIELQAFGPQALPDMLPLVNNWVGVIRDRAVDQSVQLYGEATISQIVASLPALDGVQRGRRRSSGAWKQLYRAVWTRMRQLPAQVVTEVVLPSYPSADISVRRLCCRLLSDGALLTDAVGLALLAGEPDESTKTTIVQLMLQARCDDSTMTALLNHRSPAVRTEALRVRAAATSEPWAGFEEFLGDRSRAVREVAAQVARRYGLVPADVCRRRVAQQPTPGFVAGLGETGRDADFVLVEPLLRSPDPALLRAAVTAYASVRYEPAADVLQPLINHRHGSKAAYQAIVRLHVAVDGEQCYRDYLASRSAVVRRRLVLVLCDGPSWNALPWLLRLYRDLPDELRPVVLAKMTTWRPGTGPPTTQQIGAVRDALRDSRKIPFVVEELVQAALADRRR
ncbi:MAG: hypothetical protein FWH11_00615 [Micrococcales bacterium]|nr:hypothetical protein [Micrococcales bacterium]